MDAGKIDIEVRGDGWVLAVENKIDYCEGHGQTERYASHYRRLEDMGTKVFPVYLTLADEPAKSGFFKAMNYRKLRTILDQKQSRGTSDAVQVIRWFADHIRNDFEENL
jgi:hypothetical protein